MLGLIIVNSPVQVQVAVSSDSKLNTMPPASETNPAESEEENELPPTYPCYCTFACTGAKKTWQAIFVCRTCCSSQALLCVCEGCANHCHEAELHDELEYLGMGYAYCDCNQLGPKGGCKLIHDSERNVSEWRFPVGKIQCNPAPLCEEESENNDQQRQYILDAYTIPELYQNEPACSDLVEEASMLV